MSTVMLVRARKKYRAQRVMPTKATNILYLKMCTYNVEAKKILQELQGKHLTRDEKKELYQLMRRADDIVIDCAAKLAPYQTPKLESVEVKNQVEHRFVMQSPRKITTVDEWAKLTGADKLQYKASELAAKKEFAKPTPSLYDFEEDERSARSVSERDEAQTNKRLH